MTATLYYSNTISQCYMDVVMKNLTVWDALIAWRDDLLKKDILRKSKVDYLSNMTKLIEYGLIDPRESLSEFIRIRSKDEVDELQEIDRTHWSQSVKKSRRTLFRSFYIFSQQQEIKKTNIEIPFDKDHHSLEMLAISELLSSNEDKAKSQYLTDKEINRFLLELRSINDRDFLICRSMWELKCTIHQILNLKVGDYDQENGIIRIDEFEDRFGNLRPDIKEPILKLCDNKAKTEFIFCTDKGNRIHPAQIVRSMKLASKRANLPVIISPKIIYAHARAFYQRAFKALPETEKKRYIKKLHEKMMESQNQSQNQLVKK